MSDGYENPWLYNGQQFADINIADFDSFVYIITNNVDGRKYIGKKCFYSTKKIKGKRKKSISDWKKYYGSNEYLKQDVKQFGTENFTRVILRLCKNKAEASYYEGKYQFDNDVLLCDNFYNGWIMCRVTKNHLKSIQ